MASEQPNLVQMRCAQRKDFKDGQLDAQDNGIASRTQKIVRIHEAKFHKPRVWAMRFQAAHSTNAHIKEVTSHAAPDYESTICLCCKAIIHIRSLNLHNVKYTRLTRTRTVKALDLAGPPASGGHERCAGHEVLDRVHVLDVVAAWAWSRQLCW